MTKCVIYKATTSTPQLPDKHYYGQTEDTFKGRYYGHRYDLRHSDSRRTALAKYVWKSRVEGLEPEVKWQIHTKAHPYRCGSRRCDVCLTEKLVIASAVTEEPDSTLNRRYELATVCTKPSGNMTKLLEPRYRLSWWAAPRDFFSLTVESPPSAAHPCATVYCKIPPWLNCFLVSLFSYSDAKLTMFCM